MGNSNKHSDYMNYVYNGDEIDSMDEHAIDSLLDRLIDLLPNNGKLYKYRSFSDENKAFQKIYRSMRQGYIWLSKASQFNDGKDSTINFDPITETNRLRRYIWSNPRRYIEFLLSKIDPKDLHKKRQLPELSDKTIKDIMQCYTSSGNLINDKATKILEGNNYNHIDAHKMIKKINLNLKSIKEKLEKPLHDIFITIQNLNNGLQNKTFVYSMSARFDINSNWGHYANSDNGFCIEYDFNKSKSLPLDIKKVLLNTFKISYKRNIPLYHFDDMIEYAFSGYLKKESLKKASIDMMNQILTKTNDWNVEKEWRIVKYEGFNKLQADLISKVIIDEKQFDSLNGIRLRNLIKKKRWGLTIRKKDYYRNKYVYINHSAY